MAFASQAPTTFPDVVGSAFDEFIQLSSIHKDGWGIADASGNLTLETATAKDSAKLPEVLKNSASEASLLHLRWASPGIEVDVANNHPFKFGGYSFIHNGSLHPYDALDSILTGRYKSEIKSASDSHRYFMLLMQNVDSVGLFDGITKTITDIRAHATYASLNSILLSDDYLIMINEHDVNNRPSIVGEDYYEMRYRFDGKSFAIGSSGWNQEGWELLPNHTVLVLNRKDFTLSFITIKA